MATQKPSKTVVVDDMTVDLKVPAIAAFWAWMIPGAGHFYQRRYRKAALFSFCVFSIYLLGMLIGGGKVVYAKWDVEEKRWPFLCQVGSGIITFPAVIQAYRNTKNQPLLWNEFMAPPTAQRLSEWNRELASGFDIGTLYTMVAGLMNYLIIFDAFFGPLPMPVDSSGKGKKTSSPPKDDAPTG